MSLRHVSLALVVLSCMFAASSANDDCSSYGYGCDDYTFCYPPADIYAYPSGAICRESADHYDVCPYDRQCSAEGSYLVEEISCCGDYQTCEYGVCVDPCPAEDVCGDVCGCGDYQVCEYDVCVDPCHEDNVCGDNCCDDYQECWYGECRDPCPYEQVCGDDCCDDGGYCVYYDEYYPENGGECAYY